MVRKFDKVVNSFPISVFPRSQISRAALVSCTNHQLAMIDGRTYWRGNVPRPCQRSTAAASDTATLVDTPLTQLASLSIGQFGVELTQVDAGLVVGNAALFLRSAP